MALGHTVRTFEKYEVGQNCNGSCAGDTKRCGRYNAAIVNSAHDVDVWRPDLAIELHLNSGAAGRHGAFALVNESDTAALWALAFLGAYCAASPMEVFGQGTWQYTRPYAMCDAAKRWGRKWFLEHAAPATCIIECGFVSSALDSAYLMQDSAVLAAAGAAVAATEQVAQEDKC